MSRDSARKEAWQEKRITRNQTAQKANSQVGNSTSEKPIINPESPIEEMRHSSFSFNGETPEFVPDLNCINETIREEHDIGISDISFSESDCDRECIAVDDNFHDTGNCHPSCSFGSGSNKLVANIGIFDCLKCENISVCSICLDKGGHAPHRKYLRLHNPLDLVTCLPLP